MMAELVCACELMMSEMRMKRPGPEAMTRVPGPRTPISGPGLVRAAGAPVKAPARGMPA